MTIGTVKFFNPDRGYGFIVPDGGGRDIFVHVTAMDKAGIKELRDGDRITIPQGGQVRVVFFDGAHLLPLPPVAMKQAPARALDVREPDEWEQARIPGAILMPLSESGPCAFVLARIPPRPGERRAQGEALLLVMLSVFAATWVAGGPLIARLRRLEAATRRSAASQYDQPIPVDQNDLRLRSALHKFPSGVREGARRDEDALLGSLTLKSPCELLNFRTAYIAFPSLSLEVDNIKPKA